MSCPHQMVQKRRRSPCIFPTLDGLTARPNLRKFYCSASGKRDQWELWLCQNHGAENRWLKFWSLATGLSDCNCHTEHFATSTKSSSCHCTFLGAPICGLSGYASFIKSVDESRWRQKQLACRCRNGKANESATLSSRQAVIQGSVAHWLLLPLTRRQQLLPLPSCTLQHSYGFYD